MWGETRYFLAFVTSDLVSMGIGKYEPAQGWASYQEFYEQPGPEDVFTLYTMAGKVAQVSNLEPYRPNPLGTAVEWTARIGHWYREDAGEPYALAVVGQPPLAADRAHALPLDDPELLDRMSAYLKKRKLNVPRPYLTQAYRVLLTPAGPQARLLCAHSDASALRDDQPSAVYAVALLQVADGGKWKNYPLVQQTSFKPASRSIDEHQRLYAQRDFYRFLSCLDIDGDGWKEIVLYIAKEGFGTQIEVYSFNGHRTRRRISAFKHLYN